MGQYFKAVVLKPDWEKSKDTPIMWSINPHDFGNGLKMAEHAYIGNNYVAEVCRQLGGKFKGYPFVWCGDYGDSEIYKASRAFVKEHHDELKNPTKGESVFKYIVNYDKKEYIAIPRFNPSIAKYHPLPLLCSCGNGENGGDYYIDDDDIMENYVGRWAYDRIGLENKKPADFTQIKVNFGSYRYR